MIHLKGMTGRVRDPLPWWEAEWRVFGPFFAVKSAPAEWPGSHANEPLPLDGASDIPDEVAVAGRSVRGVAAVSVGGRLDLGAILGREPRTIAVGFVMTGIPADRAGVLPVCFGADWGTRWWCNGTEVYDSMAGNLGDPDDVTCHQVYIPLRAGRNTVAVRVVSGIGGWCIRASRLAPLTRMPAVRAVRRAFGPPVRPLRERRAPLREYRAAGLRLEERPGPVPESDFGPREDVEAAAGVQARWIGIVDPHGSPYGASAFLPRRPEAKPGDEALLRRQVARIHARGMAAVTWFPGTSCRTLAEAHPEWRIVPLRRVQGEPFWKLCINSPYGQRLVSFVAESLKKYDLDGFWFDGTMWCDTRDVSCACAFCRERFEREEKTGFPEEADWGSPAFRRWVDWRYRAFMRYWGRLADEARRAAPRAAIAVNHLHRLGSAWQSAIPVDRYDADIVAGSEASFFQSSFHGRQQRAYGTRQAEVWTGLHSYFFRGRYWPAEAHMGHAYIHHALSCMTAGAMPSFGTPTEVPGDRIAPFLRRLAGLVSERAGTFSGETEPYAALHLSQAAETFVFSRRPDWGFPAAYWESVFGWHNLLCENGMLLDIAMDGDIARGRIFRYPVFVAPQSAALSDAAVRVLEEYVAGGGVLAAGPWLGCRDEWGEPADPARMRALLGRDADPPPDPASYGSVSDGVETRSVGTGAVIVFAGDVGAVFHRTFSRPLSAEVAGIIRKWAPPRVKVAGPARLHIGMYRAGNAAHLHIQNSVAYSESRRFIKPFYLAPEPARDVTVTLRGLDAAAARDVLSAGGRRFPLRRAGGNAAFTIPRIDWGAVVRIEFG